jgi:hypothetical protein
MGKVTITYGFPLPQACPNFYAVQATWAKFGVHADNMKFNMQNGER